MALPEYISSHRPIQHPASHETHRYGSVPPPAKPPPNSTSPISAPQVQPEPSGKVWRWRVKGFVHVDVDDAVVLAVRFLDC